jgi:type II secretion system protein N
LVFSSNWEGVTFGVKKLRRILLVVLGLILGGAILILLGVNLYVQSQGTQARIQHELSQRLGTTLQVRRISVTPWAGLKLSGITIPQNQSGPIANFLTAKTFQLRIKFRSLFSQRLVIKEISLINPDVVWAQNADGKWRLPPLPPEPAIPIPPPEKIQPIAPSSALTTPATPESAPAVQKQKEAPEVPPIIVPPESGAARIETEDATAFTPEIQRVNLVHGHFLFLDGKLKNVAMFDDVRFRSNFRTANDLRGDISIGKTSLRDRFFLEQLQSPLRYAPDELDFSQITARAGGGEITGRFTLLPQTEDSPFTASVKFREVQADRIVSDAGGVPGMITGRLEGHIDASGTTADQNALAGTGEIILRDGHVQQYSLLVALGQLLQIEELRQLHLDQAQIKFHLSPAVVTIDELIFRSKSIRLSAVGTVSFDGKLQLESQLAVNEKMRSQLFQAIRGNFKPIDEPGYSAVSFQVSGTVGRPKTNLMDKLIGHDLKDLGSVISSFMGGGKSDKIRKKKSADEAPSVPVSSMTAASAESPPPAATATPAVSPQPSATP